jgi:8-oxo-dGTP pyrophosphatase MutT (NUDIX family)
VGSACCDLVEHQPEPSCQHPVRPVPRPGPGCRSLRVGSGRVDWWLAIGQVSLHAGTVRLVTADERPDELRTKVHGERTVYDNPWVRLSLVDIEPPDGRRFEHHVVRLQTVVLTAVLNDQERVLMLWRHRFATDEWGWELPGGIANTGEDLAATATREVIEETGWKPAAVERLIAFQPMPGMVDTPHVVFVGRDAAKVAEPSDIEEAGRVGWVPLMSIPEMIRKGEVLGSGTLVGLLYLLAVRHPRSQTTS